METGTQIIRQVQKGYKSLARLSNGQLRKVARALNIPVCEHGKFLSREELANRISREDNSLY